MSPKVLEQDLRDLILRGLGENYMSVTCTGGERIQTGNHYQSVSLGDVRTRGFRDDRAKVLDQIDFTGKKVLDLGCNLGELSREARARGASLVDGFEYDPYFIEIGELVNALTGTTRVSFYERDIGDVDVYQERYDMVLAFAVMGQGAAKAMHRIAEITDVLVLETHRLEGNFEDGYMNIVARHFPYHRMLGESDWGVTFDRHEVRATLILAKTEEQLAAAVQDTAVPVLEEPEPPAATTSSNGAVRHVDIARTVLQEKFFSTFNFESTDELFAAVGGMNVDVAALARSHDSRVEGYDGWVLWFVYLKGYLEYTDGGEVGPGNSYFDYITDYHSQVGDPTVEQQVGWDSTREYIRRQFESMDRMRQAADQPELAEEIPPILAITSERSKGRLMIYEPGAAHPVLGTRLDGWHRIFSAKLFGVPQLRLEIMEEAEPKPVFGALESLEFDGDRLGISGWTIAADSRLDLIEATLEGGAVVGGTTTTLRQDIARRLAHMPFARRTGFKLEKDLTAEARTETARDGLLRFRLVALQEWLPIGELDAFYLPGMFDVPWPEPDAAKALMGTGDPRRLSVDSLRRLRAMLEPVKRYRNLESFETVLDWGCRYGFLEAFTGHFLPDAQVTGIDTDAAAIEWARQSGRRGTFTQVDPVPPTDLPDDTFDLVLGHSMLPRLTAAEQSAWLAELRRVMKSGGYALLTLNGELLRPFLKDEDVKEEVEAQGISSELLERYTEESRRAEPRRGTFQTKAYSIREYSRTFDVLRYAVGALNDEDVIILRKP